MTEPKRKLIFAWPYLEWGGAQIYFLAIVRAAVPNWQVVCVIPKGSSDELIGFFEDAGAICETFDGHIDTAPAGSLARKLTRQVRRIRAEQSLYRHLKKYDLSDSILHIESAPWQSWIFLWMLVKLRNGNVFTTLHNAPLPPSALRLAIWKARMRFLSGLRRFNIFVSNQDTKERIKGWVRDDFWDRIPVTYTAVNPPQIRSVLERSEELRTELRKRFNIDEDKTVILGVGNFIDRKGRWVFLEAAKRAAAIDEDTRFFWLSPVLPESEDAARIDKFGLADKFRLIHSIDVGTDRENILEFYIIADIFVLPSYVEGLPISLLEAMALRIPGISTNVYAVPEAIIDRETGLLIEPGDAAALADRILELVNDTGLRQRLGSKGSEFVMERFDERESARIAITSYEDCFR